MTDDWQDISSAPKDGTKIDVWLVWDDGDDPRRETDVYWHDKLGWVRGIRDGDYSGEEDSIEIDGIDCNLVATHWRPLPPPPHTGDE